MNEKARDFGLLVLRLSGLLLLGYHGWGKITSLATGGGERFVQGVAEMVGCGRGRSSGARASKAR